MDDKTFARNQELLNKFRPKEDNTRRDFENKVREKYNEPISKGSKTTYAQLHAVDEMAKRSIAQANERKKKIAAVEKQRKAQKRFLINAGITILAIALLAALAKGPGEGKAFDHNGDIIDVEDAYNQGR